jgi:hypothetical protein
VPKPADPLAVELKAMFRAAEQEWRREDAPFGAAILTWFPDALVDRIMARFAPLQRALTQRTVDAVLPGLVREAVTEALPRLVEQLTERDPATVQAVLDAVDLATIARNTPPQHP